MLEILSDYFYRGGPLMYPILFCLAAAVAIALERLYRLRQAHTPEEYSQQLRRELRRRNYDAALNLSLEAGGAAPPVIAKGLMVVGEGPRNVEKTLEREAGRQVRKLEAFMGELGSIVAVAPLLGLLGTVTGIIKAFQVIEAAQGKVDAAALAGGIWEALLTTAAGLIVAIPVLLIHDYLMGRIDAVNASLVDLGTEVLDSMNEPQVPPHTHEVPPHNHGHTHDHEGDDAL